MKHNPVSILGYCDLQLESLGVRCTRWDVLLIWLPPPYEASGGLDLGVIAVNKNILIESGAVHASSATRP
jgi:hypothetical protein